MKVYTRPDYLGAFSLTKGISESRNGIAGMDVSEFFRR